MVLSGWVENAANGKQKNNRLKRRAEQNRKTKNEVRPPPAH